MKFLKKFSYVVAGSLASVFLYEILGGRELASRIREKAREALDG